MFMGASELPIPLYYCLYWSQLASEKGPRGNHVMNNDSTAVYWSQPASDNGPRGNHLMDSDSSVESDENIRVRHIIYKIQRQTSCCLTSPLMATLSTHPSSTQTRPSSPVGDPEAVGDAVWKRRYLALQETVNTEKSSKRKSQ
jgi:hypothetical protein